MFQYKCLNPISQTGLGLFGDDYKQTEEMNDADAVLVRSAKMHDMELPENVTGIVADSAFSSPYDIIKKRIRTTYHCKGTLLTIAIGIWSRLLAHYSLKELSVPEVMKNNTIPVLLVHGTADSNVPVEMTVKVAENCRASKKVLLVEGAEHGTGYLVDNEAYKNALREFCS